MAYVTGVANSLADLLTALRNACTANGWTLTSNVLSKGGCHVDTQVIPIFSTPTVDCLATRVANDAGFTDAAGIRHRIGYLSRTLGLGYPATYHAFVHTNPDEVYFVVVHSVDFVQWLAFGTSPAPGLPGTGNWSGGTCSMGATDASNTAEMGRGIFISPSAGGGCNSGGSCAALFWNTNAPTDTRFPVNTACIHHGLETAAWANGGSTQLPIAISPVTNLVARQPNAWNQEAALIPIAPAIARASSKVSLVGDIAHARYLRIDNYALGQVIAYGPDEWMVFPWYRKDAAARNGTGCDGKHTGTLGWAIRYDGP